MSNQPVVDLAAICRAEGSANVNIAIERAENGLILNVSGGYNGPPAVPVNALPSNAWVPVNKRYVFSGESAAAECAAQISGLFE